MSVRVNLLPDGGGAVIFGLSGRAARTIAFGAALPAVAAFAGTWAFEGSRIESQRVALDRYDAAVRVEAASERNLLHLQERARAARAARLQAEVAAHSGNALAASIARIGNALPPDVRLESLTRRAQGWDLSGVAPAADSIGDAVRRLSERMSPYTAGVLSVSTDSDALRLHFTIALNEPTKGQR